MGWRARHGCGYDEDSNVRERKVDGQLAGASFNGGRTSRFEFDALDRETSATVVVADAPDRVTEATYWPSDQVRTRVKARGSTERLFFDDQRRVARMQRILTTGATDKNQSYA